MGGAMIVPEADEKITKATKTFRLTQKEISDLFMVFLKLDKQRIGLVKLEDLFIYCELTRNNFTDSILDVLEIIHDGSINFSDFLTLVMSYCMFEPPEILKLIFYTYDMDKEGYIDVQELKRAMNTLHMVEAPDTVTGTVKQSWVNLKFQGDNKVDFKEFEIISKRFPAILEPAFKVQNFMMIHIMGESWWGRKKRRVQEEKNLAEALWQKKQAQMLAKIKRKETRHIRKKMGVIRYYCCPCLRFMFDDTKEKLTQEEREERDRLIALARRKADLEAKNPVTLAYKIFDKKIKVNGDIVETKLKATERQRETRKETRLGKREQRSKNRDLKNLDLPTTF